MPTAVAIALPTAGEMTVSANAAAEKKEVGHRSQRVEAALVGVDDGRVEIVDRPVDDAPEA